MIASYIRVSTTDQKTDLQKVEIAAWAKAQGVDPETITWFEDRISGKDTKRPALQNLKKQIFSGKVKTVILWKLDRLARNKRDGLLADWCSKGVRILSVTQAIDLSGVVGQIVASVLLGLAEIELENIRERQSAGIAIAKKRGVYSGRKAGTTKAKPARAKELQKQGLKPSEIGKALGVHEMTARRYLIT